MVNSDELLFVVDEFDTPVKPLPRQHVFKNGLWKRTAHVWIINSKGEILCQRRSLKKDMFPGMWEPAVVGHMGPGDNYFTGAVRELAEETGITVSPNDLNLLKIYKDEEMHEFRGIFYCNLDIEVHEIKMEADEVDEVRFIRIDEVKGYILDKQHPSWFYIVYAEEIFRALNNGQITHKNN